MHKVRIPLSDPLQVGHARGQDPSLKPAAGRAGTGTKVGEEQSVNAASGPQPHTRGALHAPWLPLHTHTRLHDVRHGEQPMAVLEVQALQRAAAHLLQRVLCIGHHARRMHACVRWGHCTRRWRARRMHACVHDGVAAWGTMCVACRHAC
eukprot:364441-Chlamydomonas_euryale.AAC.4